MKTPSKFMPQSFNDLLCLVLILLIAVLWILTGMKILDLSAEVTGALIVTWTLLVQYYFRKKQSESTKELPKG
jgi:hypothetical protein